MRGVVYFLFSKRNQDKSFPDGEIVYFIIITKRWPRVLQ